MKFWDSVKGTVQKLFGNGVSGFMASWLNTPYWTRREFLQQYKGYVYPCVSAIAEEVAKIKWYAQQKTANGENMRLPRHEIIDLLQNPNPGQTGFEFIEMHQTLMELAGESFWYLPYGEKTLKPKEIYILRPDMVDVAVDKDTDLPVGYVYHKLDGTQVPFDLLEIIHHKLPNPVNKHRGMGVIEAGMVYIQTEQATANWTNNFIHNNARPAGIVSFNGKISKEDFDAVQEQWQQKYGSVKNAGKTAFVRNAEINFTQIGAGLSDIALRELKDMSKEDIMTMFRVSKPILGIVDDVNLANGKNAKRIFAENVIQPKMERLIDSLNSRLATRFDKNVDLGFDSPVPEDPIEKANYYSQGWGKWLGTNDIRRKESLVELEGEEADGILVPMNLIPIGATPKDTPQETKQAGDEKMTVTIKRLTVKKKISDHIHAKSHFDLKPELKEVFRVELYQRQKQWEKVFLRSWNKELEVQKDEVITRLNSNYKAFGRTKSVDDLLPDEAGQIKGLGESIKPNILELMKEQGQSALDLTGAGSKFAITDQVLQNVESRVNKFVPDSVKNVRDKLSESLTQGLSNGESLQDMVKRVNSVYSDAKGSSAKRIARSETSFASNRSAVEAYKQSGFVTHKEWFANSDACEFCQELDGSVVGLDEDYAGLGTSLTGADGGSMTFTFDNVGEPPLHPNCECTVIPVIDSVEDNSFTAMDEEEIPGFVDDAKMSITDGEKETLDAYQGGRYAPVNDYLRGKGTAGNEDEILSEINALDNAIDRNKTKNDLTLYRGFATEREFKPGGQFQDPGFISTSLSKDTALGFTFTLDEAEKSYMTEIRLPKGSKYLMPGAILDNDFKDEAEVILPRGTKFNILKAVPEANYTKLILEIKQ